MVTRFGKIIFSCLELFLLYLHKITSLLEWKSILKGQLKGKNTQNDQYPNIFHEIKKNKSLLEGKLPQVYNQHLCSLQCSYNLNIRLSSRHFLTSRIFLLSALSATSVLYSFSCPTFDISCFSLLLSLVD